jgi:hypothetical protein
MLRDPAQYPTPSPHLPHKHELLLAMTRSVLERQGTLFS